MPKQPRKPLTNSARAAQFDALAHQREIDRLLRENAQLKAENFTLKRELTMRPPYSDSKPTGLSIEAINNFFETTPEQTDTGGTNAA